MSAWAFSQPSVGLKIRSAAWNLDVFRLPLFGKAVPRLSEHWRRLFSDKI